jgi:hypothetical protein
MSEEIHPSLIKGKGLSKEGYSIYTLYETFLTTSYSKKRLKNWFLNPVYDAVIL